MRKTLLLVALAVTSITSTQAQDNKVRLLSPDRLTYLEVSIDNGNATYTAGLRNVTGNDTIDVPMVLQSPLGLITNAADFSTGLTAETMTAYATPISVDYSLRQGKQSQIHTAYNRIDVTLKNADGKKFNVAFRLFNNNIAFRYEIPQQGETAAIVVESETTGFRLPTDATAFICPQSDPMIGWKRTKPSYEEEYIWDAPITTPSRYGHGWTFPCLFHEGDNGWVLISETGVSSDYCGNHLSELTDGNLFQIAFPMEGENNGFGSTGAQIGLPNSTPWRTITMGQTLKPIVETTIPWDVVEPLYEPTRDYKGSRNTWSWIIWQDASINYDDQVKFIDLASNLGWEGCLIDGGWLTNIGREGMERLFAYCAEKGVKPWVWYNSNGGWNDAPQCAKQCMHNPIVRKQEMRWLQQHGVAGIKVDFFAGDKQETMRLYEAILSDANDYGIQVIFHGCTLPRGWERMYPNYVGSEAVLASENLYFSQGFCDMEARHACLHPFVRNTVGAMEYGGTVLQKRLHREQGKGNTRRTSDVFELATAIAFQCCGQNFALTPRNLTEQPQFEIDFMKVVPTTWDETQLIDGYPGKYLVLARRHGEKWYVAVMNSETAAKKIQFTIPEFAGKIITMLNDGKDGQTPNKAELKVDKRGRITLTLQPQCAAVLY